MKWAGGNTTFFVAWSKSQPMAYNLFLSQTRKLHKKISRKKGEFKRALLEMREPFYGRKCIFMSTASQHSIKSQNLKRMKISKVREKENLKKISREREFQKICKKENRKEGRLPEKKRTFRLKKFCFTIFKKFWIHLYRSCLCWNLLFIKIFFI